MISLQRFNLRRRPLVMRLLVVALAAASLTALPGRLPGSSSTVEANCWHTANSQCDLLTELLVTVSNNTAFDIQAVPVGGFVGGSSSSSCGLGGIELLDCSIPISEWSQILDSSGNFFILEIRPSGSMPTSNFTVSYRIKGYLTAGGVTTPEKWATTVTISPTAVYNNGYQQILC